MTRLLFLVVYDQYGGTVDATFMCVCTHSDTTATAVCAMAQFCAGTAYTRIDSITPAFTAETHDVFIQQQPHEPVCMVVCLWLPLCCCDCLMVMVMPVIHFAYAQQTTRPRQRHIERSTPEQFGTTLQLIDVPVR